jgi:hypothetical protein
MAPGFTRVIRQLLCWESEIFGHFPIFLIHPNEMIEESNNDTVHRSSQNPISYLFVAKIRRKLKLINLGSNAFKLYTEHLTYFVKENYDFITCKAYYESW